MRNRAFLCFPFFKEKALTFSYDDGVIYDKKLIEIFNKHGLKGTFNICTGLFGKGRILPKEEAVNLYGNPCAEVAVHGHNHLSLSNVDCAVATNDVLLNRKELEQTFGSIVKGMAYANGHYNDAVKSILKNCGINYARTVAQTNAFDLPEDWLEWHPTCHHDNQKLMELAENFVNYKRPSYFWSYRPKVFYVWGHSYEFNDKNDWEVIENFAKYISGKDDVWYATNGEIYDYVNAYDNLEWSVDCNYVYNPTAVDVYINYFGNQFIIKAGQTVQIK